MEGDVISFLSENSTPKQMPALPEQIAAGEDTFFLVSLIFYEISHRDKSSMSTREEAVLVWL